MSGVIFDFHPDDGPVQAITVPDCPDDLFEALQQAASGARPDQVFTIDGCIPAGDSRPGRYHFRARRISSVRTVC